MSKISGYGWFSKVGDRKIQFATDEEAREYEQEEERNDPD